PGAIYGGCHCGTTHLTILPNGDVYACRRVPDSRMGNVLEQPLRQIWMQGVDSYRQLDQFSKCASCELLQWCRGCPAVARCTSGSFYAADPQCWKDVPPPPAKAQHSRKPACHRPSFVVS
ncbi:MAG: SPASM domain-containing protein, partial [Clostridia bacterium]|nr:SPASM domain-containing protein [Clostridia bacterium]